MGKAEDGWPQVPPFRHDVKGSAVDEGPFLVRPRRKEAPPVSIQLGRSGDDRRGWIRPQGRVERSEKRSITWSLEEVGDFEQYELSRDDRDRQARRKGEGAGMERVAPVMKGIIKTGVREDRRHDFLGAT